MPTARCESCILMMPILTCHRYSLMPTARCESCILMMPILVCHRYSLMPTARCELYTDDAYIGMS